jgi:hypothetical protein
MKSAASIPNQVFSGIIYDYHPTAIYMKSVMLGKNKANPSFLSLQF